MMTTMTTCDDDTHRAQSGDNNDGGDSDMTMTTCDDDTRRAQSGDYNDGGDSDTMATLWW